MNTHLIGPTSNNIPVAIDFNTLAIVDPRVRLIQNDVLKNVDGLWNSRSGITFPHGTLMLGFFTAHAVQRFEFDGPVMRDTFVAMPGEPLPDVKALNSQIPIETWDIDRNGKPQAPWRRQYPAYLEDPRDAALYTFTNNTLGVKIAVMELEGRLHRMSGHCGKRLGAAVELQEQIVSRKYNKKGPRFHIKDWFELINIPTWLASAAPAQLNKRKPVQQIEHSQKKL
jgi:hypothetical protein